MKGADYMNQHNPEEQEQYVDEQLKPMQQIEGGGVPKRVNLKSMPKPIRWLGYFFIYGVAIIILATVIISFLR